jgi:hypothetical protein
VPKGERWSRRKGEARHRIWEEGKEGVGLSSDLGGREKEEMKERERKSDGRLRREREVCSGLG